MRFERDLPMGIKLGLTIAGALTVIEIVPGLA